MSLDFLLHLSVFLLGLALAVGTFFSALSTFVLPRATRSRLNQAVFGALRRVFSVLLRFTTTYEQRDALMAYYAPSG